MEELRLLKRSEYVGVDKHDPLRFYFVPVVGRLYRRRVEECLAVCRGGGRILEVGFGSGVTFLNLAARYGEIHGLDMNASVAEVDTTFRRHGIQPHLQNGSILAMPYPDDYFDTVLCISILEHLHPKELVQAFSEIRRVVKPGGQLVYGVPCETRFMRFCFLLLGYNITKHHFSSEQDVARAAGSCLKKTSIARLPSLVPGTGYVYEIGHFTK